MLQINVILHDKAKAKIGTTQTKFQTVSVAFSTLFNNELSALVFS